MVTLKEIAQECGVSAATVSNVLNGKIKASEETRKRILAVVEERGYRPNTMAQGLRSQKTRTIGIIAEDIAQFTTPAIIEGIMRDCEERGYRTVVSNLRLYARWSDSWYNNKEAYRSILDPTLKAMSSMMVDGVIYIAGHARVVECFPEEYRTPAVMAYAYAANPRVPSVLIDDEKAAYELVSYLVEKGHRKIAVIGGLQDNIHTQRRLLGAQKALFAAGIPYNPSWTRYVNWNKTPAYEVTEEILATGATAVFCMADRMAGGVYAYLDEHGMRAGRDISVVGFDGQDISYYFVPQLTTMELPLAEIGHRAAELLFAEMAGQDNLPKENLIPCTFLERRSVADLGAEETAREAAARPLPPDILD